MRKPTKTISGVTPVAVMLKPRKCNHGICSYCPNLDVPQSYTPRSPVVMRASKLNYDSYRQVRARLKAFEAMGHATDKIELIVMGGTFLEYPVKYQRNFIKGCFDGLNEVKSKNLDEAKIKNENAKHRCVALCLETRPDVCSEKDIERMLEYGCTRVELGVQVLDDEIYKKVKRGHQVSDVVDATKRLKNNCFKVGYHVMPNLIYDVKKDLKLFKKIFSDSRFRPDQIKIYPLVVMPGSEFADKNIEVYSEEELKELLIKMKLVVPEYCRIMRIMREIPPSYILKGVKHIHLRSEAKKEMNKRGLKCRCIRCREVGFSKKKIGKLKMVVREYEASGSKEIFITHESSDVLLSLMRLRIYNKNLLLRELHVFGKQVKLGEKGSVQHKGLGRELMKKAEEVAIKNKLKKIIIISGVGVRQYYRKFGYRLEDNYMVKKI